MNQQTEGPETVRTESVSHPHFNDAAVFERRILSMQSIMAEIGLDSLILSKPENVYYFSRFNPILNSHPVFFIIPAQGKTILLVHSLRAAHALEDGVTNDVQCYGKWGDRASVAPDPIDALKAISLSHNISTKRVGLEFGYLNIVIYRHILSSLDISEPYDISHRIDLLKVIKDEAEKRLIRISATLVDRAVEVMIDSLRQGASEAECSTEGHYAMRRLWQEQYQEYEVSGFGTSEGGTVDALQCWCLSGKRIAYGCDCPTGLIPQKGDFVLPMAWGKVDGYHAENERTLIVDPVDTFKSNVFATVLETRERLLEMVRPGIEFCDLYIEGAKIIEEGGLGIYLPGRMGHGIGLSAHEFPSITRDNSMKLSAGMVFTIEPGLMSERWGGVRHSDTVLVTEEGCEILTTTERGMLRIVRPS
jgi:Xaa-Pro dipeptidase